MPVRLVDWVLLVEEVMIDKMGRMDERTWLDEHAALNKMVRIDEWPRWTK